MNRIILALFISVLFHTTYGQSAIDEDLTKFQWTASSEINGINLGDFNEIGLVKLKVPIDSLKKECTIWTFTDDKIIIQKYTPNGGLETDSVICSYIYKDGELIIYHFTQDSTDWKYRVGITSTTNFIVLIRQKTD